MGTIQYVAVVLGMLLGQNSPFSAPPPMGRVSGGVPTAASSQPDVVVPLKLERASPSFGENASSKDKESSSRGTSEKTAPGQPARRPTPPELIAAAIPQQADSGQTHPVRLADLLARPAPRSKQLEIIRAYWDLATAVAGVSFRKEELTRLQSLRVYSAHQQVYQGSLSQATAALRAAENALAEAQRTLAEKAALDPKAPRPWPVDKPHIGSYRTRLEELFGGRAIPSSLRLIDRCLPWWQKAIDKRAAAVYAAEDALDALTEAYHQARTDIQPVLWAYARWCDQHTAFLRATQAYNEEIAEFALAVAPREASGSSLVSMLILASDRSQGTAGSHSSDTRRASWDQANQETTDSEVQPARYEEPIEPRLASPAVPAPSSRASPEPRPASELRQEPTLAPPRELSSSERMEPAGSIRQEPTLAPPRPSASGSTVPSGTSAPSGRSASSGSGASSSSGSASAPSLSFPPSAPSGSHPSSAPSDSLPPGAATPLGPEHRRVITRPLVPLPGASVPSGSSGESGVSAAPPMGQEPTRSRSPQEKESASPSSPISPVQKPSAPSPRGSALSPEKAEGAAEGGMPLAAEKAVPPGPYEVKKPAGPWGNMPEETLAFYPALAHAAPAVQVKQLALAFHGPAGQTEKVQQESLGSCVRRVGSAKRREVIEAYWVLWQHRAVMAALNQQIEMLEGLGRLILETRNRPLGAEAMLQLHVARLALEAEQIEAQIQLLEREEKLAQHLGVTSEGQLMASTLPHAGPYQLRLEAQPKSLVESWPVRRAAGLVPALYATLQDQAERVVSADQARSELVRQYRHGRCSIEEVLNACEQQKQATLNFLQTLTDYNQAIADYVVLVVPENLPPDVFVQTLVVDK